MHHVTRRAGTTPTLLALAALGLVVSPTAHAQGYTYQTLDGPNTLYYFPPMYGLPAFGPGSYGTYPRSINDSGHVVGVYGDQYDDLLGFFYDGMTYKTLNVPFTEPHGINNSDQIVGLLIDSTGEHGYIFDGATYKLLDGPGATFTAVTGLNNKGQVVGFYENSTGDHAFVYDGTTYKTITVPGATDTGVQGINDAGVIVGNYGDSTGLHGFLYDGTTYKMLDDPNATTGTEALGLNNAGQVVGAYGQFAEVHGFVYDGTTYTTLDVPGATDETFANGINNKGQIVGYFDDSIDYPGFRGFLATPIAAVAPEPTSVTTVGVVALIAGSLMLKARKRRAA